MSPLTTRPKKFAFADKLLYKLPRPQAGRVTYYDAKSSLGLRVDSGGRKSFFWFKSANHGRNIFKALGDFPETSIGQARLLAGDLQNKLNAWRVADYQGPNPFEKPSKAITFGELLDAYCHKHVQGHATRPEHAEKNTRWLITRYSPDWTAKPLDAISDAMMRARHSHIGEKNGKVIADRWLELARRLYTWAAETEKIYGGENPAQGIRFYGCKSRKRFLDAEELARLFAAMKKCPNRDLVDFVNISMWCGARRSDVSSMAWRDIHDAVWTVPSPKGGEPYRVPLVPEVLEILEARNQRVGPEATYVFPSTGKTAHIVEWKRSWFRLLREAQIDNLRIHDLRRTAGSWMAGLGYSLPLIGAALGHKSTAATQVYARVNTTPVANALSAAVTAMKVGAAQAEKETKRAPKRLVAKGVQPTARSRAAAERGVRNLQDVANVMAGLMSDVVTGEVTPAAANRLSAEVSRVLKKAAKP